MKPQRTREKARPQQGSRVAAGSVARRLPEWLLPVLAAVVVAITLYAPTLEYGYTLDDHALIERNDRLAPGAPLGPLLRGDFWDAPGQGSGMWRPLVLLSYAFDARLGSGSAAPGHLNNLVAHSAASALIALLALQAGAGGLAAGVAGAWFAAMPAHAESVAPVSGRTDVYCALLLLLALWLDRRARASGHAWCGPWALASLGLALLAKETAVIGPLVVALAEWADPERRRRGLVASVRWLAPSAALVALYAIAHLSLVRAHSVLSYADSAIRQQARWASWTLFPQELAFLWPLYPHSPQVAIRVPDAGTAPEVIGGGLALAAAIALVGWLAHRRSAFAVPAGLFVLGALPPAWAMWSRAYLAFGERMFYVPSAGAALLLALGLGALLRRPNLGAAARWSAIGVAGAWVVASAWANARILPAFRDDGTLYAAMVATQPKNPTGRLGLAQLLAQRGNVQEALAELDQAERLNSRLPEIPATRALIQMSVGNWSEALRQSDLALGIEPGNSGARLLRAMALVRLRRLDEAGAALERLLAEEPGNVEASSLYGQCLFLAGRPEAALPHLERAANASAGDPSVRFALGQCYARLGRPAEARREFEACLAIDDSDPGAWHRLADVCRQLGDAAAATRAMERANQLMGPAGAPPSPGAAR